MKRAVLFLAAAMFIGCANEAIAQKRVNWDAVSDNLKANMKIDNEGVNVSTMQLMIQYAESLSVSNSVYDVMRIFRDNENQGIRQMALIALYKMKDPWAMNFLKRHIYFEENPFIRKLCISCVADYYGLKVEKPVEVPEIIAKK